MANVSHDSAFTTDNFWLGGTFISNDGSNYRFQSTAGFVEVSGTSLTDSSGTPTGGTYLDITVFSDAGFTTEVASYTSASAIDFATYFSSGATTALAGDDTIDGSGGNDILVGHGGADAIDGGDGSDNYVFANGDVVSGEQITDTGNSGDTDTIKLIDTLAHVDFRLGTVSGIEALLFTDSLQTAEFKQTQLPTNLAVTGFDGSNQNINVTMTTTSFSAAS